MKWSIGSIVVCLWLAPSPTAASIDPITQAWQPDSTGWLLAQQDGRGGLGRTRNQNDDEEESDDQDDSQSGGESGGKRRKDKRDD